MQARYYDPVIDRFHSTDPIGDQVQLNLYSYVHKDPVSRVDPNGELAIVLINPFVRAGIKTAVGEATGVISNALV